MIDNDTKEALMAVTVQLLKTDSAYITGAISDEDGLFFVDAPGNGSYLLKISSVGYETSIKRIVMADDKPLAMGNVTLGADSKMLEGVTVVGHTPPVTVKADTFVYNSSAYRTPEGSTVEELVKRLPGAQVDDSGNITINGKAVSKILVNGKEFMVGDTQTALKNLPTSIIDQIKAYDQKSDLSRITGIDDGQDQTVLDFGIKKGMNKGMFANADLSIGTRDRYAERLMGAYFNDKLRVMLMGSANNVNDKGFPGGGGRGSFGAGRQGLNSSKMIGANINYDDGRTLRVDGSIRWNHSDGDVETLSAVQNFNGNNNSFTNSKNLRFSRGDNWNAQARLEWTPDSMTNIMFRPTASYSTSDGRGNGLSGAYDDDPYDYVSDPLTADGVAQLDDKGLMVNTRTNGSISYSSTKSVGGMLQYNRKLNMKGRNFTVRADGKYSDGNSKSLSTSDVHLYQLLNHLGVDSVYQTNRYNLTPSKNYSYDIMATYSEPLWKGAFLQLSYKFQYSHSKNDRSTYDFSNLGEAFFDGVSPSYRGWDSYLGLLGKPLDSYLDDDLSRYSEYDNYTHEINAMLRVIQKKYNLSAGVMFQPQMSHFIQRYQGISTDTTRSVFNVTPTLDFRYRFSDVSTLRLNYRGTTAQPGMTDLLAITDDSDPLNITMGNPGLKPSFTNNFRLFYNTYIQSHTQAIMAYVNYSNTRNSISDMVTYDDETGGRTTQPQNINGNWNVQGAFMYNASVDSVGAWNLNTFTNVNFNNYAGYLAYDNHSSAVRNITKSLTLGEKLGGSYRNEWLEVDLDGSLNYTRSRNELDNRSNMDTWLFAYGTTININTPWGMSFTTDLHENSRRGFNDKSMNTNELVWNAQVAQGFLSGKPLTVSLQFYDILHSQSNLSRVINSMQRNDTQYNSINSYAMLHVIYRLNLFGGKEARNGMNGGFGRGGGQRGGFGGGGRRGGRFGG